MKESKPKIEIQYGNEVFVLPASLLRHLDGESADLRVLLLLAADPALRAEADEGVIAARLGMEPAVVHDAITYFWGSGILKVNRSRAKAPSKKEEIPAPPSALPNEGPVTYTPEELEKVFARREGLQGLIEDCKSALGGRHFKNEYDCYPIVTLADRYGLSNEFILFSFQDCAEQKVTTVETCYRRTVEWVEKGVTTPEQLEKAIAEREIAGSLRGKLTDLLGHTLTEEEEEYAVRWGGAGVSKDLLRAAYDQMIRITGGKAQNAKYMDSILADWSAQGITTKAEALRYCEQKRLEKQAEKAAVSPKATGYSRRKKQPEPAFSSFNADEFLKDAVAASDTKAKGISGEEALRLAKEAQQKRKEQK